MEFPRFQLMSSIQGLIPHSRRHKFEAGGVHIGRDGLAYGETGRFPGGPIGRWVGELLTPPTQNLSNTISELGPHLYHVNTVERSKIWRFLVSAPNIIEFCIKNKSVFSKVGRFIIFSRAEYLSQSVPTYRYNISTGSVHTH